MVYLKPIMRSLRSYVPGLNSIWKLGKGDPKKAARYNYSVWLRHLVIAHENGLQTVPRVIAEIGPGPTLGAGLAAILSGADNYYALDIVPYAKNKQNVEVFDELVSLFRARKRIPDNNEWPLLKPKLESYSFPDDLLPEDFINECTSAERVGHVRDKLLGLNDNRASGEEVQYFAPWTSSDVKLGSVDMIISQAVMEHIDNLDEAYEASYRWLKKGGLMSHEIDFSCHGLAKEWNGHWAYSDLMWKLIRGNRPYLLNREPYSTHINYLTSHDFKIIHESKHIDEESGIQRTRLSTKYENMSYEDFVTKSVFIQAIKSL
ncbi:MAG: methyltransferase domain-containing protein [Halobacteriota archaeon]|jgi:SAM-dependent methyltransferase